MISLIEVITTSMGGRKVNGKIDIFFKKRYEYTKQSKFMAEETTQQLRPKLKSPMTQF